jgi:uncharacterized protein
MESIIKNAAEFVKTILSGAEAGHDWSHIERVHRNALLILKEEMDTDAEIVELAALLHDIADAKFHNGDEEKGPSLARDFLIKEGLDEERTRHVCDIIRHMSFGGGNERLLWSSREMEIVQDADRLDAIGAIGIARAFHYGGFRNRPLFDPQIPPRLDMKKDEYRKAVSPTLNHFYEKLLLLKDRMNTETARKIAIERHRFMEEFLQEFLSEWEGR